MKHEALLYEKLDSRKVQCHICRWQCRINPEQLGVCRMYQNQEGVLFNLNYAEASSVAIDPIEKKPLYHFYPGSLVFSLGGWGCNFHCDNCQNWAISCPADSQPWENSQQVSPEEAIKLALKHNCRGIAWTYNEPTMWFEYTLDSARLARKNGLYTVYVTNGYMTAEALDLIGPYLDAWRVDVKGFTDEFYRKIARVINWRGILETASRARHRWNMHVEVVTNIIPTLNDDDAQLSAIAGWIKSDLGELTPWHVTRFYPQYRLEHLPPTPIETIERAVAIGRQAGLKFVYSGNVPGHEDENTRCYQCGKQVITRSGYDTKKIALTDNSRCRYCGAELNIRPAAPAPEEVKR